MTTNVQTTELGGYQVSAAELRRIADALDTLPHIAEPPWISFSILPEHTAETVDAVALAVIGKPGETEKNGSDWYHLVRHTVSNIHLTVQTRVPAPPDERDAELAKLRAKVAELEAAAPVTPAGTGPLTSSGFDYTRADTDDPTPVSPARRPLHTGGVVDGGQLVDETEEPAWNPETGFFQPGRVPELVGDDLPQGAERSGPWFEVGDKVTRQADPKGWTGPTKPGFNVVGTVVEVKPVKGSKPLRQQFRAEGADWCGSGSVWWHSDEYKRKAPDCSICMEDVPGGYAALRVHQRARHGDDL